MTNVVSLETAKRLRDVGFPQPVPAFGQLWISQIGEVVVVLSNDGGYVRFAWDNPHWDDPCYDSNSSEAFARGYVFAPSPTDFLPILNERGHFTLGWDFNPETGQHTFVVNQKWDWWWSGDNPAEALATCLSDYPPKPNA
jgi:hypothetical protein